MTETPQQFGLLPDDPPKLGRFLSNTYDPSRLDARTQLVLSWAAFNNPAQAEQEWQYHLQWIRANLIGPPQASEKYTVEQLRSFGLVGVYAHPE